MNTTDQFKQHILDQFKEPIEEVEKAAEEIATIYLRAPYFDRNLSQAINRLGYNINALKSKLPTVQGGE